MKVKMLQTRSLLAVVFASFFVLPVSPLQAQLYKGKDGAENYTTAGSYVVNRYAELGASVVSGAFSITVSDITDLNGSVAFAKSVNPFTNDGLSNGDLVMIIQMQGADMNTTNTSSYGTITNYNGVGSFELKTVYNVSGNSIYFCDGLVNSYTQSGRSRAQVVRIPRLSSLTVASGVTITGNPWDGSTGGIVAIEVSGTTTVNGSISASEIGYRGGQDNKNISLGSGAATNSNYLSSTTNNHDGAKGESIVGNQTDYESLGGSLGRGAPANGGGGGNGHNSGGGGGSNAGTNGALTPWNGTGIKNNANANFTAAWNLEYPGFASDVSVGGGRGGYTYSNSNQDAITQGPDNFNWGGDGRKNIGGFGGRPLDYNGNTRLFMGGGGGAGEGNNNSSGDGGNGGGIVLMLCNGNISGTGSITSNGQNGYSTEGGQIDAGGGAGGGGSVQVLTSGTITGITISATGGKGGDQNYLTGEAEGPGGGGGGGYIATTTTSVVRSVSGGVNGLSYSTHVTEFSANGATRGNSGTLSIKSFADVNACNEVGFILPLNLLSFGATKADKQVKLIWITNNERNMFGFEIERSYNGTQFQVAGTVAPKGSITTSAEYLFLDRTPDLNQAKIYYRLKMMNLDGSYEYSSVQIIHNTKVSESQVSVFPNPAKNQVQVRKPAGWENSPVRYDLFNVNGRIEKSIASSSNASTDQITVADLPTGIYILRITKGAESVSQRFVKQ